MIQRRAGAEHLDLDLQRGSTALTEYTGIELHFINATDDRGKILRQRIAGEIAACAQCGRVRRAGRAFRIVSHVCRWRPPGDTSIGVEWAGFKIGIV